MEVSWPEPVIFSPNVVDPEAAEITACKRALLVAAEINVQKVHVELDSQSLVQAINQAEEIRISFFFCG
uniref:RNase H type-1 domain-containing protein n=1 Tax=Aegilops tauschii subsp. strangulata TaxID=200361 RepID=A0A453TCX7_AEGTS